MFSWVRCQAGRTPPLPTSFYVVVVASSWCLLFGCALLLCPVPNSWRLAMSAGGAGGQRVSGAPAAQHQPRLAQASQPDVGGEGPGGKLH